LNASFNRRLDRLPDAIAELPGLCDIDASFNGLTALPESWGSKASGCSSELFFFVMRTYPLKV
jgi:hypothetical protein